MVNAHGCQAFKHPETLAVRDYMSSLHPFTRWVLERDNPETLLERAVADDNK